MATKNLNKKGLYQEGGMVPKDSLNPAIGELARVVRARVEQGEPAEQVLYSFLQEGIPQEQLALAFETIGYDPSSFGSLMQSVETMVNQQQQSAQDPQMAQQQLMEELNKVEEDVPEAQYGFETTSYATGRPTPLYLPPIPKRGNILGAGLLFADALQQFTSKEDRDGDGLMDGTFRDMGAKRARYKGMQNLNKTFDVDYGDLDPSNYVVNFNDFAEGRIRTKDQYAKDLKEYSKIDFDAEKNKYTGMLASNDLESRMIGNKQFGDAISLQKFTENVGDLSKDEIDMMINARRTYDKGTGLGLDMTSYTEDGRTKEEIEKLRSGYRDIMLGNQKMTSAPFVFTPTTSFPLGKKQLGGQAFTDLSDFLFEDQLKDPMDFQNMIMDQATTDYARDTQIVRDAQLKKQNPGLGPTPFEQQNQNLLSTTSTFDENALDGLDSTLTEPTVKETNRLKNLPKKIGTFIESDPTVQAFADVSNFAVMGANLANEYFQEKEFRDYKNKLRNTTVADKMYTTVEDPSNKRGTFDINTGLAEPDNLVDYYAQAMYGREMYKKGGEFEPHMMYDPKTGKGYEARVPADHERMAKMGYLHKDEMTYGGELEVDNDTLAALIAAGADIEML